jgi:outer membrane protein assembly factor BamB
LYCLSAKDGSTVWKVKKSFTHSSPLVFNGKVYLVVGDNNKVPGPSRLDPNDKENPALTAFDADTGKQLWRQDSMKNVCDSVVPWAHAGRNYLIGADTSGIMLGGGPKRLLCFDADTGALVWRSEAVVTAETGSTPTIVGDIAVVRGVAAFQLTPQKAELLWVDKKGQGGSYWCGDAVVYNGGVYGASSYAPGYCKDFKTGDLKWEKTFIFCIGPVVADGKLFMHGGGGHGPSRDVVMIKATPEGYIELGRFAAVAMPILMSSPALADGKLYLRLAECVACYDLTEAGNQPAAANAPEKP